MVDETHCISKWSCLKKVQRLSELKKIFQIRQCGLQQQRIAQLVNKIKEKLFASRLVFVKGFDRPNLSFSNTQNRGKMKLRLTEQT